MLLQAKWVAVREELQAVLVGTQGPVRPNVYETRPARNARPFPVTV